MFRQIIFAKHIILFTICFIFTSFACFSQDFTDIAENVRVLGTGIGNGVAFFDFDNDGDLDLYVSSDPKDVIYRNNGDGTFINATAELGIDFIGDGIGIAFGDYDNDGDPDLYIPVNDGFDVFYQNEGGKFFRNIANTLKISNPARARSASFADFDLDGYIDIYVVNEGSPSILYRNRNGRFFEDVTNQIGAINIGPGRCCIWGDYDNDGDPDLYITNKGMPNKLYRNDIIGFKDVTNISGVEGSGDSTGCAFADYDNDGNLDIFVGGNKTCYLYHNNGDGTFTNLANEAGITNNGESCTPTFGDFDNDGYLDLYLSIWKGASVLYKNLGDGRFADISDLAGINAVGNGWSATVGDYDNDGDLDIYASFTTRNNTLYKNNGNDNNWLFIKAIGSLSNRNAIGVRAKLSVGKIRQMREISGGTGYGSQDSLILEFGLGKAQLVDELEIFWPSGIHNIIKNIKPNKTITVEEGVMAVNEEKTDDPVKSVSGLDPSDTYLMQNYPNPFNPITWIPFQIIESGHVEIIILDATGKLVRNMDIGFRQKGIYITKQECAFWNGRDNNGNLVSSGVYFYMLKINNSSYIKKMILAR